MNKFVKIEAVNDITDHDALVCTCEANGIGYIVSSHSPEYKRVFLILNNDGEIGSFADLEAMPEFIDMLHDLEVTKFEVAFA